MKLIPLIVGAAIVAGAGSVAAAGRPSPEERLARITAGRIAGKPVDCINQRDIRATQIIRGIGIVYSMNDGTIYVNRPNDGAGWLDEDDVLVTRTVSNRLCRIDIVTLIDRSSQFGRGALGLGDFVPYARTGKIRPG